MGKNSENLRLAWEERLKLYNEGKSLYAQGAKLYNEAVLLRVAKGAELSTNNVQFYLEVCRLCARRDQLYADGAKIYEKANQLWAKASFLWGETVIRVYGNINMEWKNYDKEKKDHECHLENGEIFKP